MKRNGAICNRRCYEGRCHYHKDCETHILCLNDCGGPTSSVSGFCSKCSNKQTTFHCRTLRHRKRAAKTESDWDAYFEDLYNDLPLPII
jgi:hypothetical protein